MSVGLECPGVLLAAVGAGHVVEAAKEAMDDGGRRDVNRFVVAKQVIHEAVVVHGEMVD
jgi:hypothetical protein